MRQIPDASAAGMGANHARCKHTSVETARLARPCGDRLRASRPRKERERPRLGGCSTSGTPGPRPRSQADAFTNSCRFIGPPAGPGLRAGLSDRPWSRGSSVLWRQSRLVNGIAFQTLPINFFAYDEKNGFRFPSKLLSSAEQRTEQGCAHRKRRRRWRRARSS